MSLDRISVHFRIWPEYITLIFRNYRINFRILAPKPFDNSPFMHTSKTLRKTAKRWPYSSRKFKCWMFSSRKWRSAPHTIKWRVTLRGGYLLPSFLRLSNTCHRYLCVRLRSSSQWCISTDSECSCLFRSTDLIHFAQIYSAPIRNHDCYKRRILNITPQSLKLNEISLFISHV